jgi:hypothetical protein
MLPIAILIIFTSIILSACKQEEKDPQQVEFEKKFEREAILVRTCPGDPRFGSGPTAAAIRVYRFQSELWYQDVDSYRRIDANPENACAILTIPNDGK